MQFNDGDFGYAMFGGQVDGFWHEDVEPSDFVELVEQQVALHVGEIEADDLFDLFLRANQTQPPLDRHYYYHHGASKLGAIPHMPASMMLSAGENPVWMASQMGHRDWSMIIRVDGRWIPEGDPQAGEKAVQAWTNLDQEQSGKHRPCGG